MNRRIALAGLLGIMAPLAGLAGCLDEENTEGLEVYFFHYAGAENWAPGTEHGWMFRISNPTDRALTAVVEPIGVADGSYFFAADVAGGGSPTAAGGQPTAGLETRLAPGEGTVVVMLVRAYEDQAAPLGGLRVHSMVGDTRVDVVDLTRSVTVVSGQPVKAGDHVRTATVGVWINGTSFYTNIASLNEDPDFPAGYDRMEFGGDPLPIYVYDRDRSEQPAGSKDTCHFTTITGYNALLLSQADAGTGVRFLAPEEAYTREGAEDHVLYGDALVFLNTIVGHDGATGLAETLPSPAGSCFNAENSLPPLPPA